MRIEDKLRELSEQGLHDAPPSQAEWSAFRTRGHRRLARRRAAIVLTASAAAVVAVIGLQNAGSLLDRTAAPLPPAGRREAPAQDARRGTRSVRGALAMQTWYVKGDLLYLAHRLVEAQLADRSGGVPADRAAVMAETLERVLAGPPRTVAPRDGGVRSALTPGVRLLGLDLGARTSVDLSGFSAELSEKERRLAFAQVAATVLQDDGVESVQILEHGEVVTDAPLTEASYEALLPPIVVSEPPYAELAKSFAGEVPLEGTADVFEATVVYELVGERGEMLADGFTTASCGSGCRGSFSDRIAFEVSKPTAATLNVYSPSAEDGSRMFEVSVPVYLCPALETSGDRRVAEAYAPCTEG